MEGRKTFVSQTDQMWSNIFKHNTELRIGEQSVTLEMNALEGLAIFTQQSSGVELEAVLLLGIAFVVILCQNL